MAYSVKKAGLVFLITANAPEFLTGKAANFTLLVKNNIDGTSGGNMVGAFSELEESAGTYQVPVTIPITGEFTVIISNDIDDLPSITAPLVVTAANIDDVKLVVDDLTTTLDEVQTKVNTLDSEAIEAIASAVSTVQGTVDAVQDLIMNKKAVITFDRADETSEFTINDTVKGTSSGAYGTVISAEFGEDFDTVVELTHVFGTFKVGENLTGNTGTTTQRIDIVSESNETVDSVLEFVGQINGALSDTGTGLSALKGFTDDIEFLITGTKYLNDGATDNPFYDEVNSGVASAAQVANCLEELKFAISKVVLDIESDLNSLIGSSLDDIDSNTLFGRLLSSKTIVDINKKTLEDSGYGLSALQTLINNTNDNVSSLHAIFGNNGRIKKRYDAIDQSINSLKDYATYYQDIIVGRFDSVDATLLSIDNKIEDIAAATNPVRVYV